MQWLLPPSWCSPWWWFDCACGSSVSVARGEFAKTGRTGFLTFAWRTQEARARVPGPQPLAVVLTERPSPSSQRLHGALVHMTPGRGIPTPEPGWHRLIADGPGTRGTSRSRSYSCPPSIPLRDGCPRPSAASLLAFRNDLPAGPQKEAGGGNRTPVISLEGSRENLQDSSSSTFLLRLRPLGRSETCLFLQPSVSCS